MFERAIRVARNQRGRDLIVGDVHGHFSRLREALVKIGFDPSRDRLFALGDLVDRGPESVQVIDWLGAPWFMSVKGNHEDMCLDSDPAFHMRNGGGWFRNLSESDREVYRRAFRALPVAITLETELGNVGLIHAECPTHTWGETTWHLNGANHQQLESACIWGRTRYDRGFGLEIADVRAVVVGHTPVESIRWLANTLYIDTGAWLPDRFVAGAEFVIVDAATLSPAHDNVLWMPHG